MENVHVIPTEKASKGKLVNGKNLHFYKDGLSKEFLDIDEEFQHIYITSDEVKKHGDWVISNLNEVTRFRSLYCQNEYRKIILTTDQELIEDGVQAIDDEFLEWFVNNPSCEEVEVKKGFTDGTASWDYNFLGYKIIIPQEEPKQERLKDIELEEVFGSSHCQFSVIENSLAKLYRNQEKILKAIKLLRNDD